MLAEGPSLRRRLPRGDGGVAVLDHLGTVVLISLVVGAIVSLPLAPTLAENVRLAVCRITHGDCGGARPLPRCVLATRDRTVGASATVFSVKAGHDDKATITKYGDGTARVVTADTYSLGAEGSVGTKVDLAAVATQLKAKGYAEASITASGGVQLAYDFATAEEADRWVQDNRGVLAQLVNFAGGPLADGIEQGTNWIARKLGFGDENTRAPSAVIVEVGAQLKGGGGYGASTLAGVSGDASGKGTGALEINLDNGTRKFTGTLEAGAAVEGDAAFITARAGITGKAIYAVSFDEAGNPAQLTLTGEAAPTATFGTLKNGLPIADAAKIKYGGSGQAGKKYTRSYTLDLTNPANRAAFDAAFVTAGPIVLPRVAAGPGGVDVLRTVQNFTPLIDRIGQDAVYVQAEYDTSEGGGTAGVKGGELVSFGLEGTFKVAGSKLVDAQSQDFGVPASTLGPLSSCGP